MTQSFGSLPCSVRAGIFLGRMLKSCGYTQERFAEEFGVSARHVRRWLREGIHSLDTVEQLLDFFHASFKDIFPETGDILDRFFGAFLKKAPENEKSGRKTSLRALRHGDTIAA